MDEAEVEHFYTCKQDIKKHPAFYPQGVYGRA